MSIPFQHQYPKLCNKTFSTIRGVSFGSKFAVGSVVICSTPWGNHGARVVDKRVERISELSLAFLKADGEYPGFVIESHNDFVDLINSFRVGEYTRANKWSNVSVIMLEWT